MYKAGHVTRGEIKRGRTGRTSYSGAGEVLGTEVSVMTVGKGRIFTSSEV